MLRPGISGFLYVIPWNNQIKYESVCFMRTTFERKVYSYFEAIVSAQKAAVEMRSTERADAIDQGFR